MATALGLIVTTRPHPRQRTWSSSWRLIRSSIVRIGVTID